MMDQYHDLLAKVAAQYDVQPRFIVALWGMESSYGENTGGFDTIPSLMSLAYDGRRSAFFRGELFKALQIAQTENMDPEAMEGPWAGAMGQCQFMPSAYLKYAVDFDGDGKRDIWNAGRRVRLHRQLPARRGLAWRQRLGRSQRGGQ